jgi:N-acetyl sugar amidotransferase
MGADVAMPHRIIGAGEPGYRQCTTCVMDTTDPEIRFDQQGRCHYCLEMDERRKVWNPEGDPVALERLIDRMRRDGRGREYDAVCGLSGGVDSSYLASQAKALGLRVLVIHVDTGWNSELAVKNIENIVTRAGIDLVTHVVDWEEMQDVQYAFFKSGVPNQDIPQDHAIMAAFYGFAAKHGVRWSLSGSNVATESILPPAWGYDAMDLRHILDIHRRFGRRPLRAFPQMSYFRYGVMHQMVRRMSVAKPLDLMPYSKAGAIETLARDFGWRYYGGKHYESRFTKFFQSWYLPTKWGYDKRLAHLSSLVVAGEITRADALRELKEGSLPQAEIEADMAYMAHKLGVSRQEFDALMAVPKVPHEHYAQTPTLLKRGMKSAAVRLRGLFR